MFGWANARKIEQAVFRWLDSRCSGEVLRLNSRDPCLERRLSILPVRCAATRSNSLALKVLAEVDNARSRIAGGLARAKIEERSKDRVHYRWAFQHENVTERCVRRSTRRSREI